VEEAVRRMGPPCGSASCGGDGGRLQLSGGLVECGGTEAVDTTEALRGVGEHSEDQNFISGAR